MKVQFISRLSIQGSLLISLVSCSDATQFTEKTLPAALDAVKTTETLAKQDHPEFESTSPTGETVPADDTAPTDAISAPVAANEPVDAAGNTDSGTGASGTVAGNSGTGPANDGSGTGGSGPVAGNGGTGATPPAPAPAPAPIPTPAPVPTPALPGEVFSECSANPDKAIISQLYNLPVNTSSLPDFSTMRSVGDVCLSNLNIADRDFTQGFPGVSDTFEWFALDMNFKVAITTAGSYKFYLNSDDGSILSIDDVDVINNDGTHSQQEKTGTKTLGAGVHNFHVRYYQGPRTRIALELFWKKPGSNSKAYIPNSVISRP